MNIREFVNSYAKPFLSDYESVKILAYLQTEGALTEKELLDKFNGEELSRVKLKLLDLFKAKLIKFNSPNWSISQIGTVILSQVGIDETIIDSLVDKLEIEELEKDYFYFIVNEHYSNHADKRMELLSSLRMIFFIIRSDNFGEELSEKELKYFKQRTLLNCLYKHNYAYSGANSHILIIDDIERFINQSVIANKHGVKDVYYKNLVRMCKDALKTEEISNIKIIGGGTEDRLTNKYTQFRIFDFVSSSNKDVFISALRNRSDFEERTKNLIKDHIVSKNKANDFLDVCTKFSSTYLDSINKVLTSSKDSFDFMTEVLKNVIEFKYKKEEVNSNLLEAFNLNNFLESGEEK